MHTRACTQPKNLVRRGPNGQVCQSMEPRAHPLSCASSLVRILSRAHRIAHRRVLAQQEGLGHVEPRLAQRVDHLQYSCAGRSRHYQTECNAGGGEFIVPETPLDPRTLESIHVFNGAFYFHMIREKKAGNSCNKHTSRSFTLKLFGVISIGRWCQNIRISP